MLRMRRTSSLAGIVVVVGSMDHSERPVATPRGGLGGDGGAYWRELPVDDCCFGTVTSRQRVTSALVRT